MNDPYVPAIATAVPLNPDDTSSSRKASAPLMYIDANISPPPSASTSASTFSGLTQEVNEQGARDYLASQGWPEGLKTAVINGIKSVPIRYMIFDDSGSMTAIDGHQLVGEGSNYSSIVCSRWTEQKDSVKFHSRLAVAANAPTEIRFLNGFSPVMFGSTSSTEETDTRRLNGVLEKGPSGGTPLCGHIIDVSRKIRMIERSLREAGQTAVVMICTDGEASDGNIQDAMRNLEHLPVHVIVRLCTDAAQVVSYWNAVDKNLELRLDILDDVKSEAQDVYSVNPWLNYCEPLHRMREFGITMREMDLIDERRLSEEEMRKVLALILGGTLQDYPHPSVQWSSFSTTVKQRCASYRLVWNPLKNSMSEWVAMNKLKSIYGPRGCIIG